MPRFHFHTEDGVCLTDEDGEELPDLEAAKMAAIRVLVETLKGRPDVFWGSEAFRVIVTDHAGLSLFSLELGVIYAPVLKQRQAG